jgi:hypothetical protein
VLMPQGSRKRAVVLMPSPAEKGKVVGSYMTECVKAAFSREWWGRLLTAVLEAPPNAPGAGWAPLKSKTIRFFSSSPVRRAPPSTSSCRARSRAVGADCSSRRSCAFASTVVVGRAGVVEVQVELRGWA